MKQIPCKCGHTPDKHLWEDYEVSDYDIDQWCVALDNDNFYCNCKKYERDNLKLIENIYEKKATKTKRNRKS
jgi:Fe-S-cluster containining protein